MYIGREIPHLAHYVGNIIHREGQHLILLLFSPLEIHIEVWTQAPQFLLSILNPIKLTM